VIELHQCGLGDGTGYLPFLPHRRYIPTSLAYQPDNNYQELGGDPYPVFPVLTGTFEP
jgi:hypothetical protein